MKDCIFCKIAKGEIPCEKIYEDKYSLAFLDKSPVGPGHMLLIPKKHFKDLTETNPKELSKLLPALDKLSKAILKVSDGMNIGQNNRPSAGQIVDHLHFHLVPRYKEDGLRLYDTSLRKKREEMDIGEFLGKIKRFLK